MNTALTISNVSVQQAQTADFNSGLFGQYFDYLDVSDLTARGYSVGIRSFARWLNDNGITQPDRNDIKAYKSWLDGQGYTAGTRAQYLRSVKAFFAWLDSEGLFPDISKNIKGARNRSDNTRRDAFLESDIQKILDTIDTNTVLGRRDFAMILLSVTCGLRIIELQRADISDIQMHRSEPVLYIQGKGHADKDTYQKLCPAVLAAVNSYLALRPDYKKSDPLFIGTSNRAKGQRLSEPSISTILKGRFKEAGFDSAKLTAHSLRHTAVTTLLKSNGGDIQRAQAFARHANIATTTIYAHNIDRDADHSEQIVYNALFDKDQTATLGEAVSLLQSLNPNQLADVIDFIKTIKNKGDDEQ